MQYEENKYLVTLKTFLTDEVKRELIENGIIINHQSALFSQFLIIETQIDYERLKNFHLFAKVTRAVVSKLD